MQVGKEAFKNNEKLAPNSRGRRGAIHKVADTGVRSG